MNFFFSFFFFLPNLNSIRKMLQKLILHQRNTWYKEERFQSTPGKIFPPPLLISNRGVSLRFVPNFFSSLLLTHFPSPQMVSQKESTVNFSKDGSLDASRGMTSSPDVPFTRKSPDLGTQAIEVNPSAMARRSPEIVGTAPGRGMAVPIPKGRADELSSSFQEDEFFFSPTTRRFGESPVRVPIGESPISSRNYEQASPEPVVVASAPASKVSVGFDNRLPPSSVVPTTGLPPMKFTADPLSR
jgi:hypothetical protein